MSKQINNKIQLEDHKKKSSNAFSLPHKDDFDDMMTGRKDTNDFMIFNDRRNTNELGELDILNLDLNVFTDDILKSKKDVKNQFKFGQKREGNVDKAKIIDAHIWSDIKDTKGNVGKGNN